MSELLNISFSFFLRHTRKNKNGESPIVLRVRYRKQRGDVFTGLYIQASEWDSKRGCLTTSPKLARTINQNLDLIKRKAHEDFDRLRLKGQSFTLDQLVRTIKGDEKPPALLIDYIDKQTANIKERVKAEITQATYFKYRKTLAHLQDFVIAAYKVKTFPLNGVDKIFLEKYFIYLRTTKSIAHNTAIKYMRFLKTMLTPAINAGDIQVDPFQEIKYRVKHAPRPYLLQWEIDAVANVELSTPDQNRIRDIFVFACYTGLAYIDIKQLNSANIILDHPVQRGA